MGLHKGNTNNPHGRPKGAKNKLNSELRERISDFLNNNWENIESDFQQLEPEKKIAFFEKLLQYSVPKLQNTVHDTKIDFSGYSDSELSNLINRINES